MTSTLQQLLADADAVVPRIDAASAKDLIAGGEVLVIDVREPGEVAASGRVPGAVNITRGLLEFKIDPSSPAFDPALRHDRTVIVYCGTGGRSALAGKTLKDFGFARVFNLGGFRDWVAADGDIER